MRKQDQQIESDARKSIQYLDGEIKSVKDDGIKSITYLDEKVDGVEEAGKRSIQYADTADPYNILRAELTYFERSFPKCEF